MCVWRRECISHYLLPPRFCNLILGFASLPFSLISLLLLFNPRLFVISPIMREGRWTRSVPKASFHPPPSSFFNDTHVTGSCAEGMQLALWDFKQLHRHCLLLFLENRHTTACET